MSSVRSKRFLLTSHAIEVLLRGCSGEVCPMRGKTVRGTRRRRPLPRFSVGRYGEVPSPIFRPQKGCIHRVVSPPFDEESLLWRVHGMPKNSIRYMQSLFVPILAFLGHLIIVFATARVTKHLSNGFV